MSFCPKCGREVLAGDNSCSYCGTRILTGQAELRLTNIVEVTEKPEMRAFQRVWDPIWGGRYDIKGPDGVVVGCIRSRIPCPKCGGELNAHDLRNCPSCGAHAQIILYPITVSYVFEGTDGEVRGSIRSMQRARVLLFPKTLDETESIFDARDKLLAVAKTTRRLKRRLKPGYVLLDPQGKVLFEYHGDENGNDYQFIAPSGTVIAHVQKARAVDVSPAKYYIHALPENMDSFLILVFVVLIDLTNEKLAVLNVSYWPSFGPE